MEIVSSLIDGLGTLAKRSGRSLRVRLWAVALAFAALLPISANAQALNLDFGMVRGTTSKNVCTTNAAWGTFWLAGVTSSNPAFKVTWAGGPFTQWQTVCFTVQFDASKAVSGANAGYLQAQYVQQEYGAVLTFGINANVRYSKPIHAFIAPKYQILGVTYAPPGHASNVVYGSSAKTGSTTAIESSFEIGYGNDTKYSVNFTPDISQWIPKGGVGVKVGGSSSTEYSLTRSNSLTSTIEKTVSVSYQTGGPSCDGCDNNVSVDHDFDVVWIWVNPLHLFTTYSLEPKVLEWNGYGINPRDTTVTNRMDIYPVLVGYLNGRWPLDPSRGVGAKLARAWAATAAVWPAGEGPALTCADKGAIARADPFASYLNASCVKVSSTYAISPLPGAGATTTNKRFTRLSALPTVPYVPLGPITNLNIQNVNTTTVASSVASSYTQSYSHETGFNLNAVIFTLEASTTNKGHITMTNKVTQSLTNSNTSSSGLLIVPPTDYLYPGYTQFAVFQDNLYGTFMFYPVPGS